MKKEPVSESEVFMKESSDSGQAFLMEEIHETQQEL